MRPILFFLSFIVGAFESALARKRHFNLLQRCSYSLLEQVYTSSRQAPNENHSTALSALHPDKGIERINVLKEALLYLLHEIRSERNEILSVVAHC